MDDLLGQLISHFRIVGHLGAGGMGTVYRAHDERLGRDLALKLLPASTMADDDARVRLFREARTASSLNHPHIAQIYEAGEDRGHLFIAMELVEGRPLRELIPQGGFPPSTVLRYGLQIADALAFAHEQGVIHRDLKGANVMITTEGRAKVLDFGLAKRFREEVEGEAPRDPDLTLTGMVLGTPNYLPPEVLRGAKADVRSDIWALGVLLYEMASRKLPFDSTSMAELAVAILNDAPAPLSGRIPTGLQAVIARCLSKEPSGRYHQAGEVRAALEALEAPQLGTLPVRAGITRRLAGMAIAGSLLLLLAVAFLLDAGRVRARLAGDAEHPHIGSLAVLPLANLSGDPGQEYFADGMTEELITDLAPISSLKVISRTSIMRFKNSKKSLREIAGELGVDGIAEGSVLRAGERVRITAQLIEAAKDRHLWAKSYEREVRDVLALQSEVARDITQEIRLQLSLEESARLARRNPVNPAAYELHLKGRYEWNKATDAGVRKGIAYFEQALAIDPGAARYSSGLADAYLVLVHITGTMPPREGMAKVLEYARRALAADENSAEAHASMSAALFFGDWSLPDAERHVRRAIELNPGYSPARLIYSAILCAGGRVSEAIEQDRIAMKLDLLSLIINWNTSWALCVAHRYDEALAQANRALALDPSSPLAQGALLRINEKKGDYAAALAVIEKYPPPEEGGKTLAAKVRRACEASGAIGYWRTFRDHAAAQRDTSWWGERLAMIYTKLGDRERALGYLERAVEEHSSDMLFINVEPFFEPLHGSPRFQALVRRIGITPISATP